MDVIVTRHLVLACSVTFLATPAMAVPSDPSFKLICQLYGSANSGGKAWEKVETCNLPERFKLDKSYKQNAFTGSGGGATSDISTSDIPNGIHIEVDGGHYWSVTKPIDLKAIKEEGDTIIQRAFTIRTYCGPAGTGGAGCNVKVNVYAKEAGK